MSQECASGRVSVQVKMLLLCFAHDDDGFT